MIRSRATCGLGGPESPGVSPFMERSGPPFIERGRTEKDARLVSV